MPSSFPTPAGRSGGGASRHGRAADALIAGYLRELLADDEAEPAAVADETLATAQPGQPLVARPAANANPSL